MPIIPPQLSPSTQGILSAGFNGLQASGPSMMPRSLGQIMGMAGQAGLNQYGQAGQQQQRSAYMNAQMEQMQAKQAQAQKLAQYPFKNPQAKALANAGAITQALKMEFPDPTELQKVIQAAGIDPNSPEGRDMLVGGANRKAYGDPGELEKMMDSLGIPKDSPERKSIVAQALSKRITHAPSSSNSITMAPAEKEEDKVLGKNRGEFAIGAAQVPRQSREIVDKANNIIEIVESGQPITGAISEYRGWVANLVGTVFKRQDDIKIASKTQMLEALLGSGVFPLIKELGIGARGLDTPEERRFLQRVMFGDRDMQPSALLELANSKKAASARFMEDYNKALKGGRLDRWFEVNHKRKPTDSDLLQIPEYKKFGYYLKKGNPSPKTPSISTQVGPSGYSTSDLLKRYGTPEGN